MPIRDAGTFKREQGGKPVLVSGPTQPHPAGGAPRDVDGNRLDIVKPVAKPEAKPDKPVKKQ